MSVRNELVVLGLVIGSDHHHHHNQINIKK